MSSANFESWSTTTTYLLVWTPRDLLPYKFKHNNGYFLYKSLKRHSLAVRVLPVPIRWRFVCPTGGYSPVSFHALWGTKHDAVGAILLRVCIYVNLVLKTEGRFKMWDKPLRRRSSALQEPFTVQVNSDLRTTILFLMSYTGLKSNWCGKRLSWLSELAATS